MGSSLGCIDAAHKALPAGSNSCGPAIQLFHFESPPLHEALRAMMESIEHASGAAFPWFSAWLRKWMSPTWRNEYSMLSAFFNQGIAQAQARERERERKNDGQTLATDADCVLDMIVQREVREGAEKFGKDEMLDELMTYVMCVPCVPYPLFLIWRLAPVKTRQLHPLRGLSSFCRWMPRFNVGSMMKCVPFLVQTLKIRSILGYSMIRIECPFWKLWPLKP